MEENKQFEIRFQDLWTVLKGCWILLLALLVVVTGCAYLVLHQIHEPEYTATVTIWALRVSPNSVTTQDVSIGTYLINDYRLLIQDDSVVEEVIKKANMENNSQSIEMLKNMIQVENEEGTRVLYLSVTAKNAKRAQEIANAWGEVFCDKINADVGTDQPEMIKIFSEAKTPTTPSNELQFWKFLLIGLVAAMIVYLVFLIRFVLNDKIATPEDVEQYLDLHVLGAIPDGGDLPSKRRRYIGT